MANNKCQKYSKNEQQKDLEYDASGLCPDRFTGTANRVSYRFQKLDFEYLPWLPNITMNALDKPANVALESPD